MLVILRSNLNLSYIVQTSKATAAAESISQDKLFVRTVKKQTGKKLNPNPS